MSTKVRIETLAGELSRSTSNIWKYSEVPPRVRERAVAKFGNFGDNETPIVLVLASYVRRGSTGWLLTDQGIYWRQPLVGVAMHLAYADVQRVQLTDHVLAVQGLDGVGFRVDLGNTLLWCYSNRTTGEGIFKVLGGAVEASSDPSLSADELSPKARMPSVPTADAGNPATSASNVVQDDSGQRPSVATLGTFIGVVIGGINHGVFGAMVGAP